MENPSEISAKELRFYAEKYNVRHSTGDLTPTVCELFGVRLPKECGATAVPEVVDQAGHLMNGEGKCQKALLYCPDAWGAIQGERFPEERARVEELAGFRVECATVMPSVTPVCFGTIFSGASPEVHGIRKYEKPVLAVETLFDVLAEAGLNVAIVAINNCSIDRIFRQRNIDYYSFRSDALSFAETRRLIAESDYDVIVSYMTGYDAAAHKVGPWGAAAVEQLRLAVEYFRQLVADTETHWRGFNRAVAFLPDHGQHPVDSETGGHGQDIPDDMRVNHYYRIRGATGEM